MISPINFVFSTPVVRTSAISSDSFREDFFLCEKSSAFEKFFIRGRFQNGSLDFYVEAVSVDLERGFYQKWGRLFAMLWKMNYFFFQAFGFLGICFIYFRCNHGFLQVKGRVI